MHMQACHTRRVLVAILLFWPGASVWAQAEAAHGIPLAVFWREIFPAMLLLLGAAITLSLGYIQLRREVRRRRAAEIRLAAARDLADSAALAKAAFFATMSHEIRTPLSGIIGMLELLKRAPMGGEQRQMLLAVDHASNALLNILDDVLDFSRMEANRMSLESVPVDLATMVQSVILVIGEPARRRGVETSFHISPAVRTQVMGDPLRLRQILSNLVSNSAKFTHRGHIRLTLELAGPEQRSGARIERGASAPGQQAASGLATPAQMAMQRLRFVVEDTGVGIAQDRLTTIMSPFRQADASTSRQYGGSGLGLSVSSRLATLMGGQLQLASEEGRGTRAEFVCAFAPAETLAQGAGAAGDTPAHLAADGAASTADTAQARAPSAPALKATLSAPARSPTPASASAPTPTPTPTSSPASASPTARPNTTAAVTSRPTVSSLKTVSAPANAAQGSATAPAPAPAGELAAAPESVPGAAAAAAAPSAAAPSAAAPLAPRSASVGAPMDALSPAPPRVLVADDHAINRDLLRRQLITLGYACDAVGDGLAALEALATRPYAALLTDWQMPPMNGDEVARHWREREAQAQVVAGQEQSTRMPVIIMTAGVEAARSMPADTVDATLIKPVRLEELRALLKQWLPAPPLPAALPQGAPYTDAAGAANPQVSPMQVLIDQFGDAETARRFAEQSVALLRADLAQARAGLCGDFCGAFAAWLHRVLGAMSVLGPWPVSTEGSELERTLRESPGADALPEILPLLQRLEDTVAQIEREASQS